jgi:hypothetical protein
MRSTWGEVLVDEDDYDEAKEIVNKFLESEENNTETTDEQS